jgi:DNA (cytosine-5)-methyltransferase 1
MATKRSDLGALKSKNAAGKVHTFDLDRNKPRSLVEENAYYWKGEPKVYLPKEKPDLTKPLVVDLFCGLGGLSLGFGMAQFECVLGLDIHEPSVQTFRESHPRSAVILGDITRIITLGGDNRDNLITSTVKTVTGDRSVDVLMAGIPCQGFSLANKKRSIIDERNYLFLYFIEVAKMLDPTYVLIENVLGMKTLNNGSFVEQIKKALEEEGYCMDHRLVNAADFGVPQIRKRVVFMGAKRGYPLLWPTGTFGTPSRPYRTVRDAIADLPVIEAGESAGSYAEPPRGELTEYQRMMRGNMDKLYNHQAPNHPQRVIEKIANTKPGEPMYSRYTQRIRLSWNEPSPTQVSGGIRPQFQFGHPEQARGLTVRERCRIQSIPDWVRVFGGMVQGRVQTGNAVPPLLAKAVGDAVYIGLHAARFQELILGWGRQNRREFPWRIEKVSPYQVLISEMLLRKTRAESVVPIYSDFMKRYPNPAALAEVEPAEIEALLKPIGLSKVRAKALRELGERLIESHAGEVPSDVNELMRIPHVGRYAANATLLFARNERRPIVDENVQRVLNRVFDVPKAVEIHKADHLWEICEKLLPSQNPREFGWALLDFAAAVCCPGNPRCQGCPLTTICKKLNRGG